MTETGGIRDPLSGASGPSFYQWTPSQSFYGVTNMHHACNAFGAIVSRISFKMCCMKKGNLSFSLSLQYISRTIVKKMFFLLKCKSSHLLYKVFFCLKEKRMISFFFLLR